MHILTCCGFFALNKSQTVGIDCLPLRSFYLKRKNLSFFILFHSGDFDRLLFLCVLVLLLIRYFTLRKLCVYVNAMDFLNVGLCVELLCVFLVIFKISALSIDFCK